MGAQHWTTQAPASLADVVEAFGWPRSSTFNLLSTLVARGFLYEPEARGRFYPTPRWLTLAQEIAAAEPLPEALLNLLKDLAKRTGETVWIAAPSGQHAIFLEVIESKASVRYTASVGTRVPLHGTATGQAIISQLPPAQQATLLRKAVFKRYGEGTPMSIEAVETVSAYDVAADSKNNLFGSARGARYPACHVDPPRAPVAPALRERACAAPES